MLPCIYQVPPLMAASGHSRGTGYRSAIYGNHTRSDFGTNDAIFDASTDLQVSFLRVALHSQENQVNLTYHVIYTTHSLP